MQRYISFRVLMGVIVCLAVSFQAASIALSAPASSYSTALKRYPYLTDVVGSYATINWATNRSGSTGTVSYGKVGSEACTAHSVTATKTAITVNGVSEYQWKAQLTLQTGTPYCYRVYLGTVDLLGTDSAPTFRTQLSSSATQSFSFAVIGDWGQVNSSGTNSNQAKLMSLIASSGVRFMVTTGDNGYPSGSQTVYGDLVQKGSNISAIFGPSFWKVPGASIPIFPAIGNHGLSSADTNHPSLVNWPQNRAVSTSGGSYKKETYCCLDGTTSSSYPSTWYAFDAGTARFYVLQAAWSDTNIGKAPNAYKVDYDYHWAPGTPQYEWLKADLAAHPSGLKFVFFHYPMYSDSPEGSDTYLQGSSRLEGLLKQYKVSIAFTGHAHIYERNLATASGVINYITGGGGATLGSLVTCSSWDAYAIKFTTTGKSCGGAPVPTSAAQVFHFLKVTVNGTSVTVTPINSLGQSFDVMNYSFPTSAQSIAPAQIAPETVVPATPTLTATSVDTPTATPTCTPVPTGSPIVTDTPTLAPTPFSTLAATDTPTDTAASSPTEAESQTPTVTATPTCAPTQTSTPAATVTPSPTEALTPTSVPPVGSENTLTFTTEADAHIAEASPDINFGTSAVLRSSEVPGNAQISLIRFKVSGTRDTIQDIKLRVFSINGTTKGPAVYLADNNWVESGAGGVTWNNQPQLLSSEIDKVGTIGTGAWVEYDVAAMVTGDGTYTFALIEDGPNNAIFSSREGSMPPQLIITFSP